MSRDLGGVKRQRVSYDDPYRQEGVGRPRAGLTADPPAAPLQGFEMASYTTPGYAYPQRYPYRAEYELYDHADRRFSHPSASVSHEQQQHYGHYPPPEPAYHDARYPSSSIEYDWTEYEQGRAQLPHPVSTRQQQHAPLHSFPVLSSAVHHSRPPTASYPPSSWEYTPRTALPEPQAYYSAAPPSLSAESVAHDPARPVYTEPYRAPSPPHHYHAPPPPLYPPLCAEPVPTRRASSFDGYTQGMRPPPLIDAPVRHHFSHYPTESLPVSTTTTPVPSRTDLQQQRQQPLPVVEHVVVAAAAPVEEAPADRTLATLQAASRERDAHRTSAPILAFNPAREPSATGKKIVESPHGVTYAVAASGESKGKAKSAEVMANCWSCNLPRAKCIMRGSDLAGWTPKVNFQCLDCLSVQETQADPAASEARDERLAARAFEEFQQQPTPTTTTTSWTAPSSHTSLSPPAVVTLHHEHDRITFRDTFSGAVDEIVRAQSTPLGSERSMPLQPQDEDSLASAGPATAAAAAGEDESSYPTSRLLLPPEETAKGLSASFKRQAMCCDVCSRVIGAGSVESLTPDPAPSFTIEVICRTCLDRYRACSDCGGGGELFPANRRTCTLSHARNPPLSDIDYDVLRITEIDPAKIAQLDERLRKIYYNVRMRMQARPEMLERGDGLATTFAQVEKLIVDGWTLLRPLLTVDVEPTRGLRRYVALQTSTPHKRRAKPKAGAIPKPEPVTPQIDPVEREISGFLLLEHELATGAVHVAVTMPWAISGDAFDATTILLDETLKRLRVDLLHDNLLRAERSGGLEPPLPDPTYLWGITPFKGDSRMTQSLTRRGFHFIEDRLREDPNFDLSIFPPQRTIHVPNEFMRSFRIFLRDVTEEDGNLSSEQQQQLPGGGGGGMSVVKARSATASDGGSAASSSTKPPPKKRARHLKATQR
ncbi:hypothetical protein RHOSPDRAFT_35569 [Rhodotorula sp. JG-1b]|nr:hypothetical protein RHOSPDRAFT_35569 [Rhodotorula sp. JG-1b]